jgi:DNA-binding LacI/PurR family transcriptional regulator
MADVAQRAGVSRALVSQIYRNVPGASASTRERVFAAAAELDYRPDMSARQLRLNRTRSIGVVFTMRHPLEVEIVEHMYPIAAQRGYSLALGGLTPTRSQQQVVDELLNYRSEAIVLIAPDADSADLRELGRRVAAVEIGRSMQGEDFDTVCSANGDGARIAVEHLIELGHRDIAHVDGGHNPGAAERRAGYLDAMSAAGLTDHVDVIAGDYTEDAGIDAAPRVLGSNTTAVFTGNDQSAVGLAGAVLRAGVSIPERLSIIGYDDSPSARTFVQLSTINQDSENLARAAIDSVIERLDGGRTEAHQIIIAPRLVTRETTAAPWHGPTSAG